MKRVLVTLPNWYGETLFAMPFLRALQQQQPELYIATLGRPLCREILTGSPHVHALLDYDERGAHRGMWAKARLVRALRAQHFDTAFILRKSLSRAALVALAGIPSRIGTANSKSGWLLTHRVAPPVGAVHKASSYFPLLEAVGLSILPGPYEYTATEEERRRARQWYAAQGFDGHPIAVLHPGANWSHKRWPAERFAALADQLIETHQVRVIVTGGPGDAALTERVVRSMRGSAITLAGQTTLRELAACLEQARLVIAADTGILHLAAALRRPVVALYGPTSPAITGPISSTDSSSSEFACASFSSDPNVSARVLAAVAPTCGIPSPKTSRHSSRCLLAPTAPSRLDADFSPIRSNPSRSWR